jgi:hypothetical protein
MELPTYGRIKSIHYFPFSITLARIENITIVGEYGKAKNTSA